MRYLVLILIACGSSPKPAPAALPDNAPIPPPPPSDPPPKIEGAITEAWVHGIHVLVKRNPGAEVTVADLYVRGGVRNWTATDAGIEGIALAAAVHGGTAKWPKDAFTQRLSNLGSTLEATSTEDRSSLHAWSLTPAWDQTFEMAVSAFLQPVLPADQIEVERQRVLAQLANEEASPDGMLGRHIHEVMYAGSPYVNRAIGTRASVTRLTADQLRAHLAKLRDRSRLLLVVVGDVDADHVIAATNAAFGGLPAGTYREDKLAPLAERPGHVTAFEQKLPTTYVNATAIGPTWGSADYFPARIAMAELNERVFEEVRTKRNLSYAPSAQAHTRTLLPTVEMYVTAVDPAATMTVMFGEAKKLRDAALPADELESAKSVLVTSTLMNAENAAGQAETLAAGQILGGDWRLLQDLPAKIHAVTAEQVQAWAKTHLTHFQTVVIGDSTKLDRNALESF